jgi:hypothetical protein
MSSVAVWNAVSALFTRLLLSLIFLASASPRGHHLWQGCTFRFPSADIECHVQVHLGSFATPTPGQLFIDSYGNSSALGASAPITSRLLSSSAERFLRFAIGPIILLLSSEPLLGRRRRR